MRRYDSLRVFGADSKKGYIAISGWFSLQDRTRNRLLEGYSLKHSIFKNNGMFFINGKRSKGTIIYKNLF